MFIITSHYHIENISGKPLTFCHFTSFVFSMIGSSTSASLSANASGGMGVTGGNGSQQLGNRQDNVSMGSSGQSYELIKSTQVGR